MKATGIVRRIDDLGRVVIPKEIRRSMGIREGDPLEIYTTNQGEVIFKKYCPLGDITESVQATHSALTQMGIVCAIYNDSGEKLAGGKTFPFSLDRDEIEENPSAYLTIKHDGDTLGYILASKETTAEQKATLKVCALTIANIYGN